MNIIDRLRDRFFPPFQPLPAGMYTYVAPPDAPFPYRLHLRLEKDGRGLLIANGSVVLHLNQTAAEYAYHLVQQTQFDSAVLAVSQRYGIPKTLAVADFTAFKSRLQTMIDTPDLDPVFYLDFERVEPYSGALSAPYRLDCSLTYRQPDQVGIQYAPVERVKRELLTEEWQTILRKAWDGGVPHAVFTGGEPTLRPDLVALIVFASQLGMVTGLISNGLRLAERDYLHELLQSGLDHLMLVLLPQEDQSWEALRDVLAEDLAVTVHLTLTRHDDVEANLRRLAGMGVRSVSLSAAAKDLRSALTHLRQRAAELNLRLVWDLPVPYSSANPVALELAETADTLPAGAWLYVEPDGDVLRAQGNPQVLGNILTGELTTIWQSLA
jgi:organic radical activating enzyme